MRGSPVKVTSEDDSVTSATFRIAVRAVILLAVVAFAAIAIAVAYWFH